MKYGFQQNSAQELYPLYPIKVQKVTIKYFEIKNLSLIINTGVTPYYVNS